MTAMLRNGSLSKAVKVTDLRAYLLGRGWRIRPYSNTQMIYFEGPSDDEGRPIVQLVPASEQLSDYSYRIQELISTLSIIEERPEDEVYRSIVTPTCDVLRLRLESDETRAGTLDFGFAGQFFANVRNLLVFAACSEFRPQPFYHRALRQAVAFADKCRLRPAPVGSFVVDVESPILPPVKRSQTEQHAYPTERLILLALMQSLVKLQTAIEYGDTESIFESSGRRVNANICEAILGMKPAAIDAKLEASVSWSPVWPVENAVAPQRAAFEGRTFEQVDAIGLSLRTGDEPQCRQLIGRVVRLSGEDPLGGELGSLHVTLRPQGQNVPANVDLVLTAEQYREACDAHRDGKKLQVAGFLGRVERRKWMLFNISAFAVIGPLGE